MVHNTGNTSDLCKCWELIDSLPNEDIKNLVCEIITKKLRLGITAKTVNTVYGKNFIPKWEVQQAYSIEKYPLKSNSWFSISLKLNGNRGSYINGQLLSRQGQVFNNLDHIIAEIEALGLQNYFVDGEIIRKNPEGISDNENFRIGTGILNSDDVDKSALSFVIFDCFPASELIEGQSKNSYKARLSSLTELEERIHNNKCQNISVVPRFYSGYDQDKIDELLEEITRNDCEGLMLNLDVPYYTKRHRGILKVKRFYTIDLPVVDIEEGTGKYKGTMGAAVVKFQDNEVRVGTGFTDEQRAEFWSYPDRIVGTLIEVKYKEISSDKKTGKNSLQFPVFVRIRNDKSEVSYD